MSKLNEEKLTDEEVGLFRDLQTRAAMNNGGNIPKEVANNITAMKSVLKNIETTAGRKYALSKILNNPKYGFDKDLYTRDSKYADAWSLKNQTDYTPPDVEKTIEKRNKEEAENFWNWDSDEHWTKKGIGELKRQANDAGYGDNLPGYLNKVREVQTDKDREKLYDEAALPGTKIIAPRATERFMRGEDWEGKDVLLDWAENSLYALNPGGRAAGLLAKSSKVPKYLKLASKVGDVALNPAIIEAADAAAYDTGDRAKFNTADVLLGSLINAGMNKVAPPVLKKLELNPKEYTPVPKKFETVASEKARNNITQLKAKATKDSKKVVDSMLDAYRKGEDLSTFLNELQELKSIYGQDNPKRVFRDRTAKDLLGAIREGATYDAVPLVSNKFGDAMSEDPRRTKQIVTRAVRGVPLVPQFMSELVDSYYENKEKNLEQKKINEEINKLNKEK